MDFRIADTFTASLARLTGDEQKAVKTTAFDLQLNPASPGHSFHKLDRVRDKKFWSVRVNRDIRLIVHRDDESLLLCYVDHHDRAYDWAERRKLEVHPTTGAAQLVEIRELIREVSTAYMVPTPPQARPLPPLFAATPEAELLGYGVPAEWLDEVRAATEDTLLELADHLPKEAAEALLDLAVGVTPRPVQRLDPEVDPFSHPDAQRRFRVIANVEELERALDFPWEKWTVFLHPAQKESVERDYGGPARISGTAGTGKTIVALHRAVYLARSNPDARVLLTTFSGILANALRVKLGRLIGNEPRVGERIEVEPLDVIAKRLYDRNLGGATIVSAGRVRELLAAATAEYPTRFSEHFLVNEWKDVVDAWQIQDWDAYRDVARLGRKTRLPEKQREELWRIFALVRERLADASEITPAAMHSELAAQLTASGKRPFDFVVVDEAQDVSVPQLRFLAALGGGAPNGLFLTGDLGQRIFQQPFSWKALGVDIRGRSRTLRINYRTSHQIRSRADRLLGREISDFDGNVEDRRGAISVFNGPEPVIVMAGSFEEEQEVVARWLQERASEGVTPREMGVFVRSDAEMDRARAAVEAAGLPYTVLDATFNTDADRVSIGTMHLAKGLEFRTVVVMACDDEVIPLQSRIETVADPSDLEEVYNTERHLLYVACTRARDHLLVTSGGMPSDFLDDL